MIDFPPAMSDAAFRRLVDREHEGVELKTGAGRKPLQAALVAFSNSDGGVIFIGVADDRTVIGRRRDQGLDDDIHGAALDALNLGRYDIRELRVGQRLVVAVVVHARADDVAQTSDGRVLVRRGGHNVALAPREVADLYVRRARLRYESTDSGVSVDDVSQDLAAEVARVCDWPEADLFAERWLERGLLHASGNLTVAGALVLTNPAESLRAAKFRIDVRTYIDDDDAASYRSRDIVGGPVQRQVAEATDLVSRAVGTEAVFTGAYRHDVPRLPRRVVREAIANAIAHRTYQLDSTPVVIDIRPSRVVVRSPGTLPEPVTVATLRQAQAPRNHTVIDVLRRFGLAEDSGQGIDVIEDGMRFELLDEAVFVEENESFRVELPLRGVISIAERGWLAEYERAGVLRPEERRVLLALSRETRMTNARARELLGVDSTDARARLQRLRDAGIVVQHGTRGRAYYTLGVIGPERSDQQVVLDAASSGYLTNERVRNLTGLDRVAARALLRRLVAEGRLVQHGERRGTRYHLPGR